MWHRLKADGLLTGEFPEWDFRFKDSRVETLYHSLSQASKPICDEYLEKKLYQAGTEEQVLQCQILNQSFRTLFEEIYPNTA
jgi:hypothetical protein